MTGTELGQKGLMWAAPLPCLQQSQLGDFIKHRGQKYGNKPVAFPLIIKQVYPYLHTYTLVQCDKKRDTEKGA